MYYYYIIIIVILLIIIIIIIIFMSFFVWARDSRRPRTHAPTPRTHPDAALRDQPAASRRTRANKLAGGVRGCAPKMQLTPHRGTPHHCT